MISMRSVLCGLPAACCSPGLCAGDSLCSPATYIAYLFMARNSAVNQFVTLTVIANCCQLNWLADVISVTRLRSELSSIIVIRWLVIRCHVTVLQRLCIMNRPIGVVRRLLQIIYCTEACAQQQDERLAYMFCYWILFIYLSILGS